MSVACPAELTKSVVSGEYVPTMVSLSLTGALDAVQLPAPAVSVAVQSVVLVAWSVKIAVPVGTNEPTAGVTVAE